MSRTTFSSRSEATPELFFGQLTHRIPAGAKSFAIGENSLANSARDLVNIMAKSSAPSRFILHSASGACNSARTSAGAFDNQTRNPALMPNFVGSGVPEYPGILMARVKKLPERNWKPEARKLETYCTGAYHPRRDRTRKFFRSTATISMVRKWPSALKSAGLYDTSYWLRNSS